MIDPLPPALLRAVSALGGGKITLIVGAGCSIEWPTSIPSAATCSEQCHARLVADGVLAAGDCATPSDLSSLADAVFQKTGGEQRLLAEQLSQNYHLQTATPNEGHLLAAALLCERAIASVVTLNFDLALSSAISQLGVGDAVGIIDGPDDLPEQKPINLYYLHRNVTANPETWILRTAALKTEWQGRWESVVVAKVLSTPVVVFAGLGSPADVLIESAKLIQKAIPTGSKSYQVDSGDHEKSDFFKALGLDPSAFIQLPWCDFMVELAQRLVLEHTSRLKDSADKIVEREDLTPEDTTALLDRFQRIGLLLLGGLRASWLLHENPYCPDSPFARELIADLVLAAAMVARVAGVVASPAEDGIVEFQRGDRIVASHVFVSGRGTRGRIAIETALLARHRRFRGKATPPTGAVIAGTRDNVTSPISAPSDVLFGEPTDSIVVGPSALRIFHVESLRADPSLCNQLAP